ncbi:hypothetical protein C9397_11970 [Xanthomonas vasicola pv. vasculorum]|uniref:Lipoprotein n=2 Tax=Xanthomonas vasicola pv. vasculorum TaxID=325776 RepID=A0A836P1B4_XANVA|nr:hypothetical protein C7V42_06555 [Xanthomonas vasicola pv. vasculorum]KEZ98870.1 hypothetical protein A11M_0103895 [Xanthomonas vasicola pv. vasculorum NCPPB 895]KFA37217.1 hypothetical protein KWI_0106320 [Xanthomonas vasicola pv. vasculorum NCPPB 206]TWQ10130.1 hypothetical protein FQK02_16335 [Xanthomonas vasicola]AZM70513.1 hypothetical protein CXP37_06560 [Xanthomonas vasicola pv. vasculorum]
MRELKYFGAVLMAACLLIGCAPRRPGEVPALVHAPDARAEVVQTAAGPVRGVASAQAIPACRSAKQKAAVCAWRRSWAARRPAMSPPAYAHCRPTRWPMQNHNDAG